MFLLTRFLVCLSGRNFVIDFKRPDELELEIWTIPQKWMTMNENVKKEEKKKDERKMYKTKKTKTKN